MSRTQSIVSAFALFAIATTLSATCSFAQTPPPKQTPPAKQATSPAQTPLSRMKDCLLIEDMTKERLDCYDAIIKPEPKPSAPKAKLVADCRFLKEEDERLICYNGFVSPKQAAPAPKAKKQAPPKTFPTLTK